MNLADDLFRRMREAPGRQALAFEDRRWSYAALGAAISAWAGAIAENGIRAGDRVALVLKNRSESVIALYACWAIGAVPVLVSPLYGPDDLVGALDKTAPRLAIVGDDLSDARAAVDGRAIAMIMLSALDGASHDGAPIEPVDLPADHESSILFTGGTTGTPKAVIATHGGTLATMGKLAAASKNRPPPYEIAPDAVSPNLVLLPLFHSGGQQALLFSFHVGRSVALVERFSPEAVHAAVAAHAIDNLFLLPTMVYDLAYAAGTVDLSPVRSVLVAGGAVDPETRAAFERRFNIPLLSNYGSTEVGHVAGWTARDVREGRWRPGSVGRVYAGVEVEVRGDDGRPVVSGDVGEICVRTDLTKGYAGDESSGDVIHVDGWVLSGDLGRIDADGVLYLSGRKRELIKCGGFQVFPAEVEDALRTSPIVADVAVVGADDPRLGQIPKAIVVPRAGLDAVGDAERAMLITHVRERLAHYKAVRAVEFVAALPRTPTGKIDRAALAAR